MRTSRDIFGFFPVDVACNLASITIHELRSWERVGAFRAAHCDYELGRPSIYSFRDIVGLRVLAILRDRGVPTATLRQVGEWLSENHAEPWSRLRFYLFGLQVAFHEPESGEVLSATFPHGQGLLGPEVVELEPIRHDMVRRAEASRKRPLETVGRVSQTAGIMGKQPVIDGTRIPTAAIRSFHQAGCTPEEIREQYPSITPRDIAEAITFEEQRKEQAKSA